MDDQQQSSSAGKPAAETGGGASPPALGRGKPSFWKRKPVAILGTILLAGALFYGLNVLIRSFTHESTDDAFLSANVVAVAPQVAGPVQKVLVSDNQVVQQGEPLLVIDPSDFQIQLAQKKAALASAQANAQVIFSSLDMLMTQVESAKAIARQSEAEVEADRATAEKAEADLKRAQTLMQQDIISSQEYDTAKAAADAARANLQASQQKVASDRAKVDAAEAQVHAGRKAFDRAQAQAEESKVEVQQAEQNLSYTGISAPRSGRITRKAVEPGDYVQVGQRLLAIVPTNIWVTANFKETEIKHIQPGQPAAITIDSVAAGPFAGHVDSIQAGSGAAFSLLPPENAVGNFVKVVQRVPVKIVFNEPPQTEHPLGPGMSVVPSVRVASFEVPEFAIVLVAVIIAGVVGWFWWRAASRAAAG